LVLSVEEAQWVEQRVLERGARTDHTKFSHAVRRQVTRANSKATDLRREEARKQRDVKKVDLPNGIACLKVTLDAAEVIVAFNQIDALAKQRATKDRSLKQCRADAAPRRAW
jgi:hypothetical protein